MKKFVSIAAALLVLLLFAVVPVAAQSIDNGTSGKGLVGAEVDEVPADFMRLITVTFSGTETYSVTLTSSNYYMDAVYIPAGTYFVSAVLDSNGSEIYSLSVSPTTVTVVSGENYMITVSIATDEEAKARLDAEYAAGMTEATNATEKSTESTEAATEDPVETIVNHTITAAEIVIAICITLFFVGLLAGLIWLARKYIKID